MQNDDAKVYITKIAAAQRQLDSAIRMYLSDEDGLAVHTIAAAAYRILRDLKEKRGRGQLADSVGASLFAYARDLVEGNLVELPEDVVQSGLGPAIDQIADGIRRGKIKTFDDVQLLPDWHVERKYWKSFNKPANFMKHSDDDEDGLLAESELQNEYLLAQTSLAYKDIMGTWTPEMYTITHLWNAETDDPLGFKPNEMCVKLRNIDPSLRRETCLNLIEELKDQDSSAD